MTPPIQLIAVCTGTAQPLPMGTRHVLSGIRKQPVPGPVHAAPLGLAGDEQADLSLHGGLDKGDASSVTAVRRALCGDGMQGANRSQ